MKAEAFTTPAFSIELETWLQELQKKLEQYEDDVRRASPAYESKKKAFGATQYNPGRPGSLSNQTGMGEWAWLSVVAANSERHHVGMQRLRGEGELKIRESESFASAPHSDPVLS